MDIQQLYHLVIAADSASYSEAAQRCGTSRQNISHSIKLLEAQCGTVFFKRSRGGMVVTPAGKQAVQKAQEIIGQVDALYAAFDRDSALEPHMRIAISTNLFDGMPPHTKDFFMGLPEGMQFIEMSCKGCYDSVCMGSSDVAIIMCMMRRFEGCYAFEIAGSTVYALVKDTSPLASATSLKVSDLIGYTLVVMSDLNYQYAPLAAQLDGLGFDRSNCVVISGTSTALNMIARGAVGFVSGVYASNAPSGTVAVPLQDSRLGWRFYMLFKTGNRDARAIGDLYEGMCEAFANDELLLP